MSETRLKLSDASVGNSFLSESSVGAGFTRPRGASQDSDSATLGGIGQVNPAPTALRALGVMELLVQNNSDTFAKLETDVKSGKSLGEAFANLNQTEQDKIEAKIGNGYLAELLSMSEESDESISLENFLHFGIQLKTQNDFDQATAVLGALAQVPNMPKIFGEVPESFRSRALEQYQALVGEGDVGRRAEVLMARFQRDSFDLQHMVAPMMGAAIAGEMAGAAVVGKFLNAGAWYSRPWIAKVGAGLVSYAAETSTFAFLNRAVSPNSAAPLLDDLARSALSIGALKFCGFAGKYAAEGLSQTSQFISQQLATFLGMTISHKIEEVTHLRNVVAGETFVTDTISSMISMGVGHHLGVTALGERYQKFQRDLQVHMETVGAGLVSAQHTTDSVRHWDLESIFGAGAEWANTRFAPTGEPSFSPFNPFEPLQVFSKARREGAGGVGRFRAINMPLEGVLSKVGDETQPINKRLDYLTLFQKRFRRVKDGSPIADDAIVYLPQLFSHKDPRLQEMAKLVYLDVAHKITTGTFPHLVALDNIREWSSDTSLSSEFRKQTAAHYTPLLARLPRGHEEVIKRTRNILRGLLQVKELTPKAKISLKALERLVPRFPKEYLFWNDVMAKLETAACFISMNPYERKLIHQVQDRIYAKKERLFPNIHSDAPWIPRKMAQDVLWRLDTDRPEHIEQAIRAMPKSFGNIGIAAHRLDFVIEVGYKAHRPELKVLADLHETLEGIRETMHPMDVNLADLGIKVRLEGNQVVIDYIAGLNTAEAKALEQHLYETYIKGKEQKYISTAMIPGIVLKLYLELHTRADVSFSRPELVSLPSYAEARARNILRYLPKDLKATLPQDIFRLYKFACRGSETAAKGLAKISRHSRYAREMWRRFQTHPDPKFSPMPAKEKTYLSDSEKVLDQIDSRHAAQRAEALAQIVPIFESLHDANTRLEFAIDLGKKSQGEKLQQWQEFHETLSMMRGRMNEIDVKLVDLGIQSRLDGKDIIKSYLEGLEWSEVESLQRYLLTTYLDGEATPEAFNLAPKIVEQLYREIEKYKANPPGGNLPGDAGVFGILLGLSTGLSALTYTSSANAMVPGIETFVHSNSSVVLWTAITAGIVGTAIAQKMSYLTH